MILVNEHTSQVAYYDKNSIYISKVLKVQKRFDFVMRYLKTDVEIFVN